MKRLVIIKYDGSSFKGSQKQSQQRTVQGELEKYLKKSGILVKSEFTSRTDAGVHANHQGVVINVNRLISNMRLMQILEKTLPPDIETLTVNNYNYDIHPRYQAKVKKYIYLIKFGNSSPFDQRYYTYLNEDLLANIDIAQIDKALNLFCGVNDFSNFTARSIKTNNVREIIKVKFEINDKSFRIEFYGKGFVRYQVRYMVGAIIGLIEKKVTIQLISELLKKTKNNKNIILKAPPNGLYLSKIWYEGDHYE
jgi:tRNA pseudouridine38-40 synthase